MNSAFNFESVATGTPETGIHPASTCKIRVLGIGGGGGNSLQHMINESLSGVEFIAINTDSQALKVSTSSTKVQIGVKLTNGLGAGCDPNKGRKAAEESKEDIKKLLQGSDMVFITAGMGGGTGTGAAPIIAEIAKETGALTIAVVTKPFKFEGKRHMVNAESGISELSKHVDSLIVIDNDKLLKNLGANISIMNAFNEANDVLLNAVRGITDAITDPGFINLDFEDVKTVMRGRGHAMIGTGMGQGANFVEDAVQKAIHSPLIEPVDISSAAGLLANFRVNPNFSIAKWNDVCNAVQAYADEEADCKFGMTFDESLEEDQIVLTVLITGISSDQNNIKDPYHDLVGGVNQPLRGNNTTQVIQPPFPGPEQVKQGGQTDTVEIEFGRSGIPNVNNGATGNNSMNFVGNATEVEVPRNNQRGVNSGEDMFIPPILRNKSM